MSTTTCPVAHDLDLFAPAFHAQLYEILGRVREETPVAYLPEHDLYVVTRYAEVQRIFNDGENFSALNASSPILPLTPEAARILRENVPRKPALTNADPPRHTQMRAAVSACLGAPRWRKLQPLVRAYAEKLVAQLVQKEVADLVADLTFPLPAFAGFTLLGFPSEDVERLKDWCGHRVLLSYGRLDAAAQVEAAHSMAAFWRYAEAFVSHREAAPGDDLTTDLLALAREHPDQLARDDIPSLVFSIALAGHETTTSGIGNALLQLLTHRDEWERLKREPQRIATTVEEALRHDSPLIAWRRTARHATPVGDVVVPAGARLLLLVASAHHDSAVFADPERFDIGRANARAHMAFGSAAHYCLGAPLARFEMRVAIESLMQAAPDIRLHPEESAAHVPNSCFRCLTRLLVQPRPQ